MDLCPGPGRDMEHGRGSNGPKSSPNRDKVPVGRTTEDGDAGRLFVPSQNPPPKFDGGPRLRPRLSLGRSLS